MMCSLLASNLEDCDELRGSIIITNLMYLNCCILGILLSCKEQCVPIMLCTSIMCIYLN